MITRHVFTAAVLSIAIAACSRRPTAESGTPPENAAVSSSAAELRGTYWRLAALPDRVVNPTGTAREAHLVLNAQSNQVTGSGGCNRMFGSYQLSGDALTFSGVGSTKMACQDGMDVENAFLSSLQRVAKYRISGQQLELLDASGALVARFDAKPK